MIYEGKFADSTNVVHFVRIYTGWSPTYNADNDTVVPITMGETPFVTTMDSGDDTIYKAMKGTGATVQVVTEDYMFDIYSPTAQGTRVELSLGGAIVEWVGYATPNLYDMSYQAIDTIELECIDGISTLQYVKYTPVGESKAVRSFREIVDHILQQCHCYNNFYVPRNTNVPGDAGAIMDKLYVSENNFYDKKATRRRPIPTPHGRARKCWSRLPCSWAAALRPTALACISWTMTASRRATAQRPGTATP